MTNEQFRKKIGKNLKAERERAGYSIHAIYMKNNKLTRQQIKKIEAGGNYTINRLNEYCEVLQIQVKDIV